MEAPSQSPNGVAIDVKGISKRFGTLLAVDNVSFTVPGGEIFGLLGPNGAGKSTLIRMLTTLVPPTSGTAVVAGHDIIHDPNAVRASIGVIPQNMTSDPELTCAENIGIHARLYGITGARRRQRTAELLEAVGLSDRANALAATLSGGMRRRLEIARGLVHDPQILFLDEPTTGLDPASRISVWEMITHLRAQQGRTLFLTTHYMDEADRLCDRVAIVDQRPHGGAGHAGGAESFGARRQPHRAAVRSRSAPRRRRPGDVAGGQVGARAGLGHLSHIERPRPGFGAGVDRAGARAQARAEKPVGGIHQSGRRIPALHRPRAGGDGRSRRSRRPRKKGGPR